MRKAPLRGEALIKINSCGEPAPCVIAAQQSRPSTANSCLALAPPSFNKVGYQSTMCSGALTTVFERICPGQFANAHARTPPSYNVPLPARKEPLLLTTPGLGPPLSAL